MSIVRVGSTQKFAEGWDSIFSGKKASGSGKKAAAKKSGKKKAAKGKGRK